MLKESINKKVYELFLKLSKTQVLSFTGFNVEVSTSPKAVTFKTTERTSSSITIFANSKQSMRYVPYTLDSLMAQIILAFGYHSAMHDYMDQKLKDMVALRKAKVKKYTI